MSGHEHGYYDLAGVAASNHEHGFYDLAGVPSSGELDELRSQHDGLAEDVRELLARVAALEESMREVVEASQEPDPPGVGCHGCGALPHEQHGEDCPDDPAYDGPEYDQGPGAGDEDAARPPDPERCGDCAGAPAFPGDDGRCPHCAGYGVCTRPRCLACREPGDDPPPQDCQPCAGTGVRP